MPGEGASVGAPGQVQALLVAADGLLRDTHVHERLGELAPAFSAVLGSWLEPFAAAMREMGPVTAHSQAAARALTDLARLTGAFARDAEQRLADEHVGGIGSASRGHYAELAGRIDDRFRELSSSPEFDRARRHAAAAVLDWLEHDRATAASIVRALEPPSGIAPDRPDDPRPAGTTTIPGNGNATLTAYPGVGATRASVLLIPGFTVGARVFDLDPRRSAVHTLAQQGVETWRLDWGRSDATDRMRSVANQLERIDRAVDAVREVASHRRPALMGHFHGGLLALLYCIRHPDKAGALVTLSTPVEFEAGGDVFGDWLRACGGERLVDVFGNVPGSLVAALVGAASPMRWCGGGFLALLGGLESADAAARFARLELVRRFPPAFPGETFRALYRSFYRDNAFATDGCAVIDGHRYDLSRLAMPLLNVFARDDHVVPPAASAPLATLAQTASCWSREHHGGHFDLLIGHGAHTGLWPDVATWLIGRTRGA